MLCFGTVRSIIASSKEQDLSRRKNSKKRIFTLFGLRLDYAAVVDVRYRRSNFFFAETQFQLFCISLTASLISSDWLKIFSFGETETVSAFTTCFVVGIGVFTSTFCVWTVANLKKVSIFFKVSIRVKFNEKEKNEI